MGNQSIFISEAGAYRALAGIILSRGHGMDRAVKHGKVFKVVRRGCVMGYGVAYEGEVLKEGV
jgi:hypothetical protein